MAIIIPFPSERVAPIRGLTEPECRAVRLTAADLSRTGRATGTDLHPDARFMRVFDPQGRPYWIGREDGVCYLFDPDENQLADSRRFTDVLAALRTEMAALADRIAQ